jgi:hypothetical protein
MSFEEFVRAVAEIPDDEADGHFRAQHTFVVNSVGHIGADFVGRYEALAGDFRRVCDELGLSSLPLPRVQAARTSVRYSDFYTPETRRVVASRFREDVELFGYEFGGD